MSRATAARPSPALAYLVLAAMGLQLLLRVGAPGFAAWSFDHAHLSLDGRVHAHVHAWDRGPVDSTTEPAQAAQTQPAPASEVSATAVALPVAMALLALAGAFVLARPAGIPAYRGIPALPVTPPPRG